jgi:acyl-lipid omega-6 desaturase (Delta-12 desaturase)
MPPARTGGRFRQTTAAKKRGDPLSPAKLVKAQRRALVERFATPDNLQGFLQIANTLIPYAALWYAVALSAEVSYWLVAACTLLMVLFLTRIFVLMHECGHGSVFRSGGLNRACGFLLGVLAGMPQYVWSQHHAFHHSTNGNWAKYRGPFIVDTVDDYAAMNEKQRRRYRLLRCMPMLPLHAFVYVLFMPRYTWLRGTLALLWHVVRGKKAEFRARYWNSSEEYWHMTWNNVVMLALWLAMSLAIGAALFFAVYIASVTIATTVGLIIFTVQHNFPGSYASGEEGWDYHEAAIHGTSFLVLPAWLNWFTANIAYHHIHHLSASIPNYRLAECHREYQDLFAEVARVRLSEIPQALEYILWDSRARRIISVAEFEAARA